MPESRSRMPVSGEGCQMTEKGRGKPFRDLKTTNLMRYSFTSNLSLSKKVNISICRTDMG